MELVILFWIVRTVGNAWETRVEAFHQTRKAAAEHVGIRYPKMAAERRERLARSAARRSSFGWFAFQLRHGWPAVGAGTWTSVQAGWDSARDDYEDWLSDREREGDRPTLRQTLRHAWRPGNVEAQAAETAEDVAPEPEVALEPNPAPNTAPEAGDGPDVVIGVIAAVFEPQPTRPASPAPAPTPDRTVVQLRPVPNPPTTGEPMEAQNLDQLRQIANNEAALLGARVSGWEQLIAGALAGGLGNDRQSMAIAAHLQETLANAQVAATQFVQSLGKHASGEEYASTGHAAKTEYLQRS